MNGSEFNMNIQVPSVNITSMVIISQKIGKPTLRKKNTFNTCS